MQREEKIWAYTLFQTLPDVLLLRDVYVIEEV